MAYGMKYTNGKKADTTAFPFKADLTKKTGKGPRAEVKKTELEKMTEEEYQMYMNNKHHSNVPTFTNSIPSPNERALANVKSKKASNKKRSDAEKALEAKEDAEGK